MIVNQYSPAGGGQIINQNNKIINQIINQNNQYLPAGGGRRTWFSHRRWSKPPPPQLTARH